MEALPALRAALLAWYRAERRRLPWREFPSVYATVVSEFMLQQTQVDTMLPYFERWMALWPSFEALAQASPEAVLHTWQGLGYYSRARNLLKLAQAVVQLGAIPGDPQQWRQFPGVGAYTAAAIMSIALNFPIACVDGNIVRIATRLTGDHRCYKDSGSAARALDGFCQELLNRENPGDHNQALMELGATVCRKSKPLCGLCPLRPFCKASQSGTPELFPHFEPKRFTSIQLERFFCHKNDALLLFRHGLEARRLAGFYELPLVEALQTPKGALLYLGKRSISTQRFEEAIYAPKTIEAVADTTAEPLFWVPIEHLGALTLTGPHRRWIQALLRS